MPVYLVRHAEALSRTEWGQEDDIRPLTKKGMRQAEGLAQRLAGAGVRRVVSSPSVRCVRTVEPLAQQLGVEVERANELLEGTERGAAVEFVQSLAKRKSGIVVCSHGDVIPDLLRYLSARGMKLRDEMRWPKGSAWELQWDGTHFVDAHYHPPSE